MHWATACLHLFVCQAVLRFFQNQEARSHLLHSPDCIVTVFELCEPRCGQVHATLPVMRAQADGLIINVTSVSGKRTISDLAGPGYCASKFAMNSLGAAINLEVHGCPLCIANTRNSASLPHKCEPEYVTHARTRPGGAAP